MRRCAFFPGDFPCKARLFRLFRAFCRHVLPQRLSSRPKGYAGRIACASEIFESRLRFLRSPFARCAHRAGRSCTLAAQRNRFFGQRIGVPCLSPWIKAAPMCTHPHGITSLPSNGVSRETHGVGKAGRPPKGCKGRQDREFRMDACDCSCARGLWGNFAAWQNLPPLNATWPSRGIWQFTEESRKRSRSL